MVKSLLDSKLPQESRVWPPYAFEVLGIYMEALREGNGLALLINKLSLGQKGNTPLGLKWSEACGWSQRLCNCERFVQEVAVATKTPKAAFLLPVSVHASRPQILSVWSCQKQEGEAGHRCKAFGNRKQGPPAA